MGSSNWSNGIPSVQPCILVAQSLGSLPLRIGIAFGECTIDPENDIYIGQPIVDAHRIEQRQEWIGGAFHPSCWNLGKFQERIENTATAINYPVPVKPNASGPPLAHALNWTIFSNGIIPVLEQQEYNAPAQHKVKWQNARASYEAQKTGSGNLMN
jgi:hypothetical protein